MSRSLGCSSFTRRLSMTMSPSLTLSSPAIMLSSVDLPQPEGPTSTRNSPASTATSMPFKISVAPNRFLTPLISSDAMSEPISECHAYATQLAQASSNSVLSFDRTCHQTAYKVASAEDVHEQRGQRRDHCRRH